MTPTDPTRPLSRHSEYRARKRAEQQERELSLVLQTGQIVHDMFSPAERAVLPPAALREALMELAAAEVMSESTNPPRTGGQAITAWVPAYKAEAILRAALSPAPTPVEPPVEFDPDPRWKPGEHDDLRIFVQLAARNMFVRLREKANVWGRSWRTGYYPDSENIERLQRAVGHLIAANDAAHRDDANPAQMSEPWRRAADVANQAFMLADPSRGWHEDAAQRAARLAATKAGSS